ncbi:MAG: hypothetical protein NTV22_04345, partial [bacterium]|nr:hypothetical protein [bacterium]
MRTAIPRMLAFALLIGLLASVTVQAAYDLTTYSATTANGAGAPGRYIVNLGITEGRTTPIGSWSTLTGIYEFACRAGNANNGQFYRMNDGLTNGAGNSINTYGGNPNIFGYNFKRSVTVETFDYYETDLWGDCRFTNQPQVEVKLAMNGAWVPVTCSCTPAYNTNFSSHTGTTLRYRLALATPTNCWGIRINDYARPTANFAGFTELTVNGNVGQIKFTENLARAADAAPFLSKTNSGVAANINDGDMTTKVDTFGSSVTDYVGVTWAAVKSGVVAVGVTHCWFSDGGEFGSNVVVQYTTDGTTWQNASGQDLGAWLNDWPRLRVWRNTWGGGDWRGGFMITFDRLDNIKGIRLYGMPGLTVSDAGSGFIGVYEFEVFKQLSANEPVIVITTPAPVVVSPLVTSTTIDGTNENIVGSMLWVNAAVPGISNWFSRSGASWSALITGLQYGNNVITVWGTNVSAVATSAAITITRDPRTPVLSVLPDTQWYENPVTSVNVSGTVTNGIGAVQWN